MAKNEAKIKFTADCKQFNEDIAKADSSMRELRAELKLNETQMKATGETVDGLRKKHEILNKQLETQKDKTEALANKLEAAKRNFGENSTEASKWRTQLLNAQTAQEKLEQAVSQCTNEIEQLERELKDSESAMNQASDSADKLDRNLDDAGDAAEEASDGFTVMKGAIADLISEAVQFGINKISEFIGYLRELPEATRELRQDMATLETSFETAGLTTEQATETWKDLYAVFGEDDRAVEAANLIAKMSDSQEDLNKWVTITQGVWGTYQDSLPVEGLAEAAMESAKTGKVTGVLADALNWSSEAATMFSKYMGEDATTAEEAFNKALAECTTEQERQSLITETMTALYGEAADKYEEASGSQIAAKEAVADLTLAEAELAEKIEPVTSAWDGMKAQLITAVTPAIEAVCGVLEDVLGWLNEHPAACKVLAVVLGTLAIAFTGLAVALGIYTVAQWAANSAIIAGFMPALVAALPIIAAVVAAIAVVAVIAAYWDTLKAAAVACWDAIKSAWNTAAEWFKTSVIDPLVTFFKGLWGDIQNIWDSISDACQKAWDVICDAVQVGIMFIGSILSAAFQIITLPFRFIWENCKEYVFAAWNWIKEKVTTAVNAVSSVINKVFSKVHTFFSTVWNACKSVVSTVWSAISTAVSNAANAVFTKVSNIWNKVKTATSTAFNACKSVATTIWNALRTAVSNVADGVRTKLSSVWNSIKSTASNVWNNIKNAILKPIEAARDKIKGIVDKIKGFFSGLKISLPHIKLPHFSITGKFSLSPPSVPKFKVSWYKDGAIFTKPTLFNTPYGIKGVGEAGAEAVLPIEKLERYVTNAVDKAQSVVGLDRLAQAVEDLANRPNIFRIGDRDIAMATASASDSVNGLRTSFKSRGLALE